MGSGEKNQEKIELVEFLVHLVCFFCFVFFSFLALSEFRSKFMIDTQKSNQSVLCPDIPWLPMPAFLGSMITPCALDPI